MSEEAARFSKSFGGFVSAWQIGKEPIEERCGRSCLNIKMSQFVGAARVDFVIGRIQLEGNAQAVGKGPAGGVLEELIAEAALEPRDNHRRDGEVILECRAF